MKKRVSTLLALALATLSFVSSFVLFGCEGKKTYYQSSEIYNFLYGEWECKENASYLKILDNNQCLFAREKDFLDTEYLTNKHWTILGVDFIDKTSKTFDFTIYLDSNSEEQIFTYDFEKKEISSTFTVNENLDSKRNYKYSKSSCADYSEYLTSFLSNSPYLGNWSQRNNAGDKTASVNFNSDGTMTWWNTKTNDVQLGRWIVFNNRAYTSLVDISDQVLAWSYFVFSNNNLIQGYYSGNSFGYNFSKD